MFERDLQQKLERIFGFRKTTFLAPNYEAPEQDTLFVVIAGVNARAPGNEGKVVSRVTGTLVAFSQAMLSETDETSGMRLPFGYFTKRVAQARREDTAPFFFSQEQDITNSPARMQNLHERQVNFTFLHSAQYDPDRGELASVDINLEVN